MSSSEKLADRIRKLLALAGNNPSEAEAAAAMERASALMADHNLTMAQVETLGTDDERVQEWEEASGRRQTWARDIWDAVAKSNFCFYCFHTAGYGFHLRPVGGGRVVGVKHKNDLHIVIGTRGNVDATKVMASYLVETVERLARECKEVRGVHEKHAFKLGCARRLKVRLATLRAERRAEKAKETSASPSNLPTVADLYHKHDVANRSFYKELHNRMPKGGSGSTTSQFGAYERGRAAGDNVGLNTQVKVQRALAPPKAAQ
jgi:Protein of unknown function (DUF2786)